MNFKNLAILKTQTGVTMCGKCSSQHCCWHIGENNKVYCAPCANAMMGIPHDTPSNQDALNKAIGIRDDTTKSGSSEDKLFFENKEELKVLLGVPTTKSDTTVISIRKLNTGYHMKYGTEEHFFPTKTACVKHFQKEVL